MGRVDETYEITGPIDAYQIINDALEAAGVETQLSELSRIPQNTVELDASGSRRVLKLMDALEDNDDVQSVTANFNIPDEIMEEVAAE